MSKVPCRRLDKMTDAEKRDLIAFLKTLSADGTASLAVPPRLN